MARLFQESGGERRDYRIHGQLVMGRMKSNQVFIDDLKLSREHARIQFDGKVYVLQDLGSKNGTFLNGQRLQMPAVLRPGDRIKLGDVQFRFELEPGDPPAPPPDPGLAPAAAPSAAAQRAERENVAARVAAGPEPEPVQVVGPGAGTTLVGWLILAGVAAGGAFVLRFVFAWALRAISS